MNIVLFEKSEVQSGRLPLSDPRAQHLLKVLRRRVGDTFDVGEIDGLRGKATLISIGEEELTLKFELRVQALPLLPLDLVVGLSRPQTMRKILNEATTLGARSIQFVTTRRGEPSYSQSKLWSSGEWQRHVLAGVEQAFTTFVPEVSWGHDLEAALKRFELEPATRLALDNYEGECGLASGLQGAGSVALAIGSERGWTAEERNLFRDAGWRLCSMGERVLRTETAVVSALSIASSCLDPKT